MVHDGWHEPIIEGFLEDMDVFGVELDWTDVKYTGFWNQGDGASFTVMSVDTLTFIEAMLGELPEHLEQLRQKIDWDFKFGKDLTADGSSLTYPEWKTIQLALGLKQNKYLNVADLISLKVFRVDRRHFHENSVEAQMSCDWVVEYEFEVDMDDIPSSTIHHSNEKEYDAFADAVFSAWQIFVNESCKKLYRDLEKYYSQLIEDENEEDYID